MGKSASLKIWNGRGYKCRGDRFYVCATSAAQAGRMLARAEWHLRGIPFRKDMPSYANELKTYFCKGCWGCHMQHVTPEIGVWYSEKDGEKPFRVIFGDELPVGTAISEACVQQPEASVQEELD